MPASLVSFNVRTKQEIGSLEGNQVFCCWQGNACLPSSSQSDERARYLCTEDMGFSKEKEGSGTFLGVGCGGEGGREREYETVTATLPEIGL